MESTLSQLFKTKISRGQLLVGGAATSAAVAAALAPGIVAAADAPAGGQSLNLDVCCDGRTLRFDNGIGSGPTRGAAFIVNGKIFPSGTFGSNPDALSPDSAGSIGTWVCRGNWFYDLAEVAKGKTPHVATTQYYIFDDGSMLVSDGLEGGVKTVRVVTGGAGKYTGSRGSGSENEVSKNSTMLQLATGVALPAPNIVFSFNLM